MKRINSIIKNIKPNSVVADIGSDHALLSTSLLSHTPVKHIYNVEKNSGPFQVTVSNTKTFPNVTNIQADGLNFIIKEEIDYCVIAGMGAFNIINIMNNANAKKCKSFILQPNSNTDDLRRFLQANGYFVVNEEIIEQNHIYYDLMVVSKHSGTPIVTEEDIYFGPINLKHKHNNFINMYRDIKSHIINKNLHVLNSIHAQRLHMINNL
jgi:tRNA (adenine22-N1)-methyltransferase